MNDYEKKQLFDTVIAQHKSILYKIARTYCHNEEDRQDLIQEMMIQLWQSTHKYNNQFKISTFIYRIALNVAISFYRKTTTRSQKFTILNEQMLNIPMDDKTDTEQQLNTLEQFIRELKEIEKAIILLYLEDKSHQEIAEIMGISVTNIGTKIGRIKDKLKTRFSNQTL